MLLFFACLGSFVFVNVIGFLLFLLVLGAVFDEWPWVFLGVVVCAITVSPAHSVCCDVKEDGPAGPSQPASQQHKIKKTKKIKQHKEKKESALFLLFIFS